MPRAHREIKAAIVYRGLTLREVALAAGMSPSKLHFVGPQPDDRVGDDDPPRLRLGVDVLPDNQGEVPAALGRPAAESSHPGLPPAGNVRFEQISPLLPVTAAMALLTTASLVVALAYAIPSVDTSAVLAIARFVGPMFPAPALFFLIDSAVLRVGVGRTAGSKDNIVAISIDRATSASRDHQVGGRIGRWAMSTSALNPPPGRQRMGANEFHSSTR